MVVRSHGVEVGMTERSGGASRVLAGVTLLIACLTPGCAAMRLGSEPVDKILTKPCVGGSALPAPLLEPGYVLLFGEVHGTQELPAFFGEAVCWASGALPVQVGLELQRTEEARVATYLASAGSSADVEALTAGPVWTQPLQDGKTSLAMLALLDRLRRLISEERPIEVFLFDLSDAKDMGERDQRMAENIAARSREHPEALTMALTGNVHAQKDKEVPWNPNLVPMGWYLVDAGVRVRSLNHSNPAGSAWTLSPSGKAGSSAFPAVRPLPSGRTIGIELLAQPAKGGFDGLYATQSLTASPPALQAPPAPPESTTPDAGQA